MKGDLLNISFSFSFSFEPGTEAAVTCDNKLIKYIVCLTFFMILVLFWEFT